MTAIKTKSTTVAKGFALYVGISEQDAQDAGLTLAQIAQALKQTIATLVPEKANEQLRRHRSGSRECDRQKPRHHQACSSGTTSYKYSN